jgi:hypothetical protein
VDVGIDSLCFGREEDLGTPVEDMMSLAAIAQMPTSQVHTKILTCFGVGLEPCGTYTLVFVYALFTYQSLTLL